MKIVHVCRFKLNFSNGVQAAVWELALGQAASGHEVSILSIGRIPKDFEVVEALANGVTLLGVPDCIRHPAGFGRVKAMFHSLKPTFVHIHSEFIPANTCIAYYLWKIGIPYTVSPHGNLAPEELARKSLRKQLYLGLFENRILRHAAFVTCVSRAEASNIERLLPGIATQVVPNAINVQIGERIASLRSARRAGRTTGIFLGKADLWHKGLDILFQVGHRIPIDIDCYVISHPQPDKNKTFDALVRQHKPENVRVLPPVYGSAKDEVIAKASFVIHLARWEAFGLGIIEAMASGLPAIISDRCNIAADIQAHQAGLVVPLDAEQAAREIKAYIADPERMRRDGQRAYEWVQNVFSRAEVAQRSIDAYSKATEGGVR